MLWQLDPSVSLAGGRGRNEKAQESGIYYIGPQNPPENYVLQGNPKYSSFTKVLRNVLVSVRGTSISKKLNGSSLLHVRNDDRVEEVITEFGLSIAMKMMGNRVIEARSQN